MKLANFSGSWIVNVEMGLKFTCSLKKETEIEIILQVYVEKFEFLGYRLVMLMENLFCILKVKRKNKKFVQEQIV